MTTLVIGHDQFDRSMKNRMIQINTHQNLTAVLPQHLIVEHILPRIPVKPLFRFKIVCKFWNSIISSYEFAQTHLKFSSLCPQFVVLNQDHRVNENYYSFDFKLFLLPFDRNDCVGELVRLDFDQNWVFTVIDIVGSCNGLLCFYLEVESRYSSFIVWNPVTRQCREIKVPVGEDLCLDYGFGYVSLIDDYKIVAQFSQRKLGGGYLYVFSLRTGEWKSIDKFDDVIIVINDTFNWLRKSMNDWQNPKCILGFDLVDDKLKEIPWISCFNQYKRGYFFGMKGCVSFYCEGDQGSDVWVLNQYGDKNSWKKLFSVNLGEMSFLNFTETGKCLVETSGKLGVIDSSQESPEESQVGACFSGQIAATGVYVESFISPFVNQ
ncbi:F-box/kelch-repeat protein At3g23880-like [Silene latifolia]|uniref:F-box/kelch-repeat protein At3g23880-like n=1 Tax=Silene latifolia TaxID=37657 RepID=UPI003D77B3C3